MHFAHKPSRIIGTVHPQPARVRVVLQNFSNNAKQRVMPARFGMVK